MGIFVYASVDKQVRMEQFHYLVQQHHNWGDKWFLGGNLNEIKGVREKKGGRMLIEGSFRMFRQFIRAMHLREINFVGREWTWANNKVGKSFVEERLDRILASTEWLSLFPTAVVHHVQKQTFDHCLLLWENKPQRQQLPKHFYFDKRWLGTSEFENEVEMAGHAPQQGSQCIKCVVESEAVG